MASEDEIDIDVEPESVPESVKTRKRSSSSTAMPLKPKKKYAKRAPVWQHFVLKEGDDLHSICTSPMISHIERCKSFKEYDERDKQQKLSGVDGGNMKVVRYDPLSFRRAVNTLVRGGRIFVA
ncbi:hypothetical protein ARALYDRAFT_339988 [Arabidopsis lyrata subsp. lyrata]|uniref:Uncharacterized protein n=1 Tax=Arabidopsis lyrata subsp. lyrata TaxID=81972 RepID=D7KV99_ARALL|nr:hypothetical protein ARALYDRAFT_339988 [Arabidopsis lyrata subsp. lyrata]